MNAHVRQAHFVATGRVQGVCFRWFVQEEAQKLKVHGWVRNCRDGSVEGILQGDESSVYGLIQRIRKGPPLARVLDVTVTWDPPIETFKTFDIRL